MKKAIIPVLISAILVFSTPYRVQAAAPTDFVACWDMEETSGTRFDYSANNNDLSDINTVLYGTGVKGNAADFEDTTTEYLQIADASQTGLDITGDRTFVHWLKPESTPTSGNAMAYFFKWGASQAQYGAFYINDGGTYKVRFLGYNTCGGANINHDFSLGGALSTSNFSFLVTRYKQSTGYVETFLNGSALSSTTAGFTGGQNCTGAFSISSLKAIQWYWDGMIDQVEVYNRLLTQTEISDLYASGSGLDCARTSAAVPDVQTINDIIFY